MKGLLHNRFELIWAGSWAEPLWGFSFFKTHSIPLCDILMFCHDNFLIIRLIFAIRQGQEGRATDEY